MCKFIQVHCIFILLIFAHKCFGDPPGPCAILDTGSSSICISLEEINSAFRQARLELELLEPINFPPLKAHHHHHEIDQLGLVLLETSRILAKSYKLDYQQIHEFLPKLDIELTEIWKFCPAIFKEKKCKITKYRTLSGHCNNINHPDWGAAITPFVNLLPPDRHDGLSAPREYGKELDPLPSPRLISAKIHKDKVVHDHAITIMLIAWGQIIDHDITFTSETKEHQNPAKDPDCCSHNIFETRPSPRHHNCYPIVVPANDEFYSNYNHHCMNFLRSTAGVRPGCRLGPRTAFNTISSFLDASFLYGSNIELGKELRTEEGGKLNTLPIFNEHQLKDLLPLKTDDPDDGCIRPNSDIFCFLAGDLRVNEQLVLTTLHTIFVRQHNQFAHSLAEINPHWDDERLYQETRRIIIGIVQHITFNEFLPMILGKELLHEYGLSVEDGYWTGYDPDRNPGALEEFITSAFRFGHSLLPHKIERWSTSHHYIDSTNLHEMLRQPFDMFRPGHADTYIMGLVNQIAQVMDEGVTEQVTTLLFKEKGSDFGMDLAAMNIQRGRDHGVPPYAAYRKICGLSLIEDWDDLIGVMRNETVHKYKYLYNSPWDIDLWSGGVSEIPKEGALIGPTFGCIIAKQFQAIRYGDRFWYEIPDLPSSFSIDQLEEIKAIKLSRLLCDNGDHIKTIQHYAMVHPDHVINPRVSCYSKALPSIDLERWREDPNAKEEDSGILITLQKAHLHTDLETLKPPLYDKHFDKTKSTTDGANKDKSPEGSGDNNTPLSKHNKGRNNKSVNDLHSPKGNLSNLIPPFQKMPDGDIDFDEIVDHHHNIYDAPGPPYGNGVPNLPSSPLNANIPHGPPPPPPYYRKRRRPNLLRNLVRKPNKILMKIFRRGRNRRPYRGRPLYGPFAHHSSPHPSPIYPQSTSLEEQSSTLYNSPNPNADYLLIQHATS